MLGAAFVQNCRDHNIHSFIACSSFIFLNVQHSRNPLGGINRPMSRSRREKIKQYKKLKMTNKDHSAHVVFSIVHTSPLFCIKMLLNLSSP